MMYNEFVLIAQDDPILKPMAVSNGIKDLLRSGSMESSPVSAIFTLRRAANILDRMIEDELIRRSESREGS